VVNYLAGLGVALAAVAMVLFVVYVAMDRLPLISRKRLLKAQREVEVARHLQKAAEARRDAARALVDAILLAGGQYGTAFTRNDPQRIAKAEADMDAVFTQAVIWRETDQFGGMMGTGYVRRLLQTATTMQDRAERPLP
jgi:hypothetical protein